MAALAAGACGLIVEVHPNPAAALSDGFQSLDPEQFAALARQVHPGRDPRAKVLKAVNAPTASALPASPSASPASGSARRRS
ncbi:MAG TPA: hypothetical protein VK132_05035 [Gemmatimonadales bacterium]|nr:hypothetical protein [Gemmatimonadales bacterium]